MATIEQVKNDKNYLAVLDHGFVGLIDVMGDDSSIVQAARVSYGKGTKTVSEDRGLIRYLLKHKHTTPFEMVEFKFHCKMTIFVARQWIRHRTANVNEYSGRYSIMPNEFYVPECENIQPQSKSNKQGRDGPDIILQEDKEEVRSQIEWMNEQAYYVYEVLSQTGSVDDGGAFSRDEDNPFPGIANELARMVLPLNNYTEWYWKIDLHNLFHFLKLRMDSHAQYEIRMFANAMYHLIRPHIPLAAEAFEDFILNEVKLSQQEIKLLELIYEDLWEHFHGVSADIEKIALIETKLTKREVTEFLEKLSFLRKKNDTK